MHLNIDIDALREIGWSKWDPIGLLHGVQDWRNHCAKDEYDHYLQRAAKKAVAGVPEGEIASYLIGIVKYNIGMGSGERAVRCSVATARAIVAYVRETKEEMEEAKMDIDDGIEIDWLAGNCPVQAEGRIDGKPFYFRARGVAWRLEIRNEHQPEWAYGEPYGEEPFAAGWMDVAEAKTFIRKAAELYRAEKVLSPPSP